MTASVRFFTTSKSPLFDQSVTSVSKYISIIGNSRQYQIYLTLLNTSCFGTASSTTYTLWMYVMLFAEDYTHLLFRNYIIGVTRFSISLKTSVVVTWKSVPWDNEPIITMTNLNMLWNMFDESMELITDQVDNGFSLYGYRSYENLIRLKEIAQRGKCKHWSISPTEVLVEGTKKYEVRLPTFLVWFNRICNHYTDYY